MNASAARAPGDARRSALVAVDEMILFALLLGDRQEAALLVPAALFLFVFLPLVIIGFIIYRVVVAGLTVTRRTNRWTRAAGREIMKDEGGGMK